MISLFHKIKNDKSNLGDNPQSLQHSSKNDQINILWFKPWQYFNSDAILWKNKSKSSDDFPLNERCSIPNISFKMCRQSKKHPFSITVFRPHSKVQHRFNNDQRMLLCTRSQERNKKRDYSFSLFEVLSRRAGLYFVILSSDYVACTTRGN